MTRSYRLVAYLPAPLITEEAVKAPCAGLAPSCFRGESLAPPSAEFYVRQDCDWSQKMFKIIFSC